MHETRGLNGAAAAFLRGSDDDRRLLASAEDLVRSGRREAGFQVARRAAHLNEPGAWTYLGTLYADGVGTTRSDIDAAQCYARAHRAGDKKGSGLLAISLITGVGTDRDVAHGLQLLLAAANAGDVTAMKNCSKLYRSGERYGILRNDRIADSWKTAAHEFRRARRESVLHSMNLSKPQDTASPQSFYLDDASQHSAVEALQPSLVPEPSLEPDLDAEAGTRQSESASPSLVDGKLDRSTGAHPTPVNTVEHDNRRQEDFGEEAFPPLPDSLTQTQDRKVSTQSIKPPLPSPLMKRDGSDVTNAYPHQTREGTRKLPPSTPAAAKARDEHRAAVASPNDRAAVDEHAPEERGSKVNTPFVDEQALEDHGQRKNGNLHVEDHSNGRRDSWVQMSQEPMPGLPNSPLTSSRLRDPGSSIRTPQVENTEKKTRTLDTPARKRPPPIEGLEQATERTPLVEIPLASADRSDISVDIDENPTYYQDKLSKFDRFLINCDVRHVGIPLGCTAFTAMWRAMYLNYNHGGSIDFQRADNNFLTALHFFLRDAFRGAWYSLWKFTCALYAIFLTIYAIRSRKFPYLLVEDFQDAVQTNFFAAIAIVGGVLTVAVPPPYDNHYVVWFAFVFLLLYKALLSVGFWYKDWLFSVGQNTLRRTSPIYFMAVINFFILATVSAHVGAIELAIFLFMLGSLFWMVVFSASFSFLAKTYDQKVDKPSPTLFCFLAPPAAAGIGWMAISKARGLNPLNDVTRFYAATLFFLLLLLARLADLFWALEFNVGWWAYVFPLGSAATMTILLAGLFHDNAWIMLIAYSTLFATTALMVIVASRTVVHIAKGKIPQSPVALATYERQKRYEEIRAGSNRGRLARIRSGLHVIRQNLSGIGQRLENAESSYRSGLVHDQATNTVPSLLRSLVSPRIYYSETTNADSSTQSDLAETPNRV